MPAVHDPSSDHLFVRRFLIGLLLVGLALLAWHLAEVLLLVFGASLVAVILRAIADPIAEKTRLSSRLALLVAVLFVFSLIGLAGWLFGAEIASQASTLRETLPAAWKSFEERLGDTQIGERILGALRDAAKDGGSVASELGSFALTFGSAVADFLLVLVAGVFLAAEPRLYRRGLVKLFPRERHDEIASALDNTGRALRKWLLGQLVSMTIIGVFTGLGLWLVGVPSALMLGLIAGLAEFVPLLGPILAAVPGLLLALLAGPETALWALGVYLVIQQIESNLVTPLVEKKAVSIPPVITLFGVLALGVIFGVLGVLLAAPLTVVIYVLVKQLYVREALGEATHVPGEPGS